MTHQSAAVTTGRQLRRPLFPGIRQEQRGGNCCISQGQREEETGLGRIPPHQHNSSNIKALYLRPVAESDVVMLQTTTAAAVAVMVI